MARSKTFRPGVALGGAAALFLALGTLGAVQYASAHDADDDRQGRHMMDTDEGQGHSDGHHSDGYHWGHHGDDDDEYEHGDKDAHHMMGHQRMHRHMMQHGMMPGMMSGTMSETMSEMMPGMMWGGMMHGMGPGMIYGFPASSDDPLSVEDVTKHLEARLSWHGNPRLKLGRVATSEDDADVIVAEIVTLDDSLVQRWLIDRGTGRMTSGL